MDRKAEKRLAGNAQARLAYQSMSVDAKEKKLVAQREAYSKRKTGASSGEASRPRTSRRKTNSVAGCAAALMSDILLPAAGVADCGSPRVDSVSTTSLGDVGWSQDSQRLSCPAGSSHVLPECSNQIGCPPSLIEIGYRFFFLYFILVKYWT